MMTIPTDGSVLVYQKQQSLCQEDEIPAAHLSFHTCSASLFHESLPGEFRKGLPLPSGPPAMQDRRKAEPAGHSEVESQVKNLTNCRAS
jgi:hypothetical protein